MGQARTRLLGPPLSVSKSSVFVSFLFFCRHIRSETDRQHRRAGRGRRPPGDRAGPGETRRAPRRRPGTLAFALRRPCSVVDVQTRAMEVMAIELSVRKSEEVIRFSF